MKAYYEARAHEYDDWYEGRGRFAGEERPGWHAEVDALVGALRALPPARTLDVACGTGFLTQHLAGDVVGLDQSPAMLSVARRRRERGTFVEGDALEPLPFPDGSFDRVFTGHFYGHLRPEQRAAFLAEARRVAPELVVVDSAERDGVERESVQERVLTDGSRWTVYKRYFRPDDLLAELGGGRVLVAGRYFAAVAA